MQHQLLQSERLATVGQMAATFAHEIGSPMSSLSAHVQSILADPTLADDQRETLVMIEEQLQAVVQIVDDLLRAARKGPSEYVPTDVNEILRAVVRLVEPTLIAQSIDVRMNLTRIPFVRGYPLYLQEAFLNLVKNAVQAMPQGGVLEVKTSFEEKSGRVSISIVDTGPGIDPSVMSRMFDDFVTTKAIGQGTGLGLGVVKDIVRSHQGTFRISANRGGGTAAHITFPAEKPAVFAS
jgi:signal transduction histidine kinase